MLNSNQYRWLVTGCAGFIGSHLVEFLLAKNQYVVGIDNFITGKKENIAPFLSNTNFNFIEADISVRRSLTGVCNNIDFVLHQAALGSVPRSVKTPIDSHQSNVTGFVNLIWEACQSNIKRFVYASSSSVYGDNPSLPKIESNIGRPLSPYAATKLVNEVYASTFSKNYGLETIGLRYFNVFGPRQRPDGPYAAVIPKWINAVKKGTTVEIYGDGTTSRDFCYVKNAVQANIRAALTESKDAINRVYNVAAGRKTDLTTLLEKIQSKIKVLGLAPTEHKPVYLDPRPGDIRHSLADISLAKTMLGYTPEYDVEKGLEETVPWYIS